MPQKHSAHKHTPIRTCVGCGTERSKRELVRIVRTPEGAIIADATGKKSGRGAYLDPSNDCLDKGLASGTLERALDLPAPISEDERVRLAAEVRRLAEERKKVLAGPSDSSHSTMEQGQIGKVREIRR